MRLRRFTWWGRRGDPDGYVTGIEWYANDRLIGEERLDFLVPPPAGERQLFEFKWQGVPEGRFQLTARVTDDQGLVSAWSEPVRVAVLGEREVPVVMLFVVDPVAREGSSRDGSVDTATFKVRRSGGTEEPLEVYYEVTGTAENGVDYARLEGRLSLAAGSRWGRIVVTPVDDRLEEGPETVVVRIVPSPVAAPVEPYRVGWPAVAAALILDDEVTDVPTQRIRDWLKLRLECERGRHIGSRHRSIYGSGRDCGKAGRRTGWWSTWNWSRTSGRSGFTVCGCWLRR
jgi:hypothetical protein